MAGRAVTAIALFSGDWFIAGEGKKDCGEYLAQKRFRFF
jgi:hypothetical protein